MPEISDIVRIKSSIIPRGELRKVFGVTLFLTTDGSVLDAQGPGRIKTFSDLSSLQNAGFPTDSEPYLAANTYFRQDPFPKSLMVARWAKANVLSELRGGPITSAAPVAAMKVANGSLRLAGRDITGINTSANNTFTALAATLQTAIAAVLNGVTVTWDAGNKRLVLKDTSYRDYGSLADNVETGTDLSAILNLDSEGGATAIYGHAAESVADALTGIENLDSSFYFVVIEKGENDGLASEDVDSWCAARPYQAFLESNLAASLVTNETASRSASISGNESQRTNLAWNGTQKYLAISAAARLSGVNMNGINSLITLNLKVMPGVDPDDDLSDDQIKELERKNMNYYTRFGSSAAYRDGRQCKPGIWTDVQYFLDWFENAAQVNVFNALYSSDRIPQTPPGVSIIKRSLVNACRNGVRNGGIAPGYVQPTTKADIIAATGNIDFDGYLSNGYLIHAGSIADQAQSEREARKAPPFRVWMKGSGAIHEIDIDVRFEN